MIEEEKKGGTCLEPVLEDEVEDDEIDEDDISHFAVISIDKEKAIEDFRDIGFIKRYTNCLTCRAFSSIVQVTKRDYKDEIAYRCQSRDCAVYFSIRSSLPIYYPTTLPLEFLHVILFDSYPYAKNAKLCTKYFNDHLDLDIGYRSILKTYADIRKKVAKFWRESQDSSAKLNGEV